MKTLISLIVVVALAWGGYAYYKNHNSPTVENTSTNTNPTESNSNAIPLGAVMEDGTVPSTATTSNATTKNFTISAGNYFFAPKTLSVNKGDTVNITVSNSGGFHDFKIDEFKVSTSRLSSGQSATVTFVADKAGSFQYYCSVGDHRAMGMWGTITVN